MRCICALLMISFLFFACNSNSEEGSQPKTKTTETPESTQESTTSNTTKTTSVPTSKNPAATARAALKAAQAAAAKPPMPPKDLGETIGKAYCECKAAAKSAKERKKFESCYREATIEANLIHMLQKYKSEQVKTYNAAKSEIIRSCP